MRAALALLTPAQRATTLHMLALALFEIAYAAATLLQQC